ncbi:MAG TPA: PAS domain S-box protein [Rectinemataceae bacterium]|nr:PAS domain S-box protein [Rectinemataceae bacterium]
MSESSADPVRTILLVEDEAIIALNEKRQLEGQGYRVIIAYTGEKAVEAVESGSPIDLILMDINLGGGIDGTEAASKILQLRDIPVVFLSSHSEPEIVSKTEAITSYGYALKGSGITVLDASIKMAFKLFYANREIKRSSVVIQEHNQLLETILESFPGAVFWKDANLVYRGCNTAEARDAGLESPEDVIGKNDYDLFRGGYAADFYRESDRQVLRSGKPVLRIEEKYEREAGAPLQYETSKFPLFDAEGRASGVFGVSIDITELKEAQERLVTANEMLRKILDSIPQFIAWKNRNSVFLGCNRNYASFFGLPEPQSIVGKTDRDLPMSEEDMGQYFEDDRWVMETDRPKHHIIERNTDACGREVWLDTNKVPLHDAEGRVNGLLVAFSDITQRWEAERALAESEQLYLSILDASPDGIAVTDLSGEILMLSPKAMKMLGYEREESIGRSVVDFVASEDRGRALAGIARMAAGEAGELGEYRAIHKDGSLRVIEVNAGTVRDADGEHGKIILVMRDIFSHKLTGDSLRESHDLLKAITDAAQDAIVMMDKSGRIAYWSPAAEKIFGYAADEAIGRNLHRLLASAEDGERIEAGLERFHSTGEGRYVGTTSEILARTKSGAELPAEMTIAALNMAGDWNAVAVLRDITERKQKEATIAALLEEKDLILKEVHHRVKNNMGTIQSLLTLQAGSLKDGCAVSSLEDAAERVQSMMVLYDKLYQSSSFTSLSAREYLPALVEQVIGNFPSERRVRIETEVEDFSLSSKLLQPLGIIVNELVTNAMKYAFVGRREGTISLSASLAGSRVAILFADDGVGFPEAVGLENSQGFGLMLVHALTEQLRGSIRMERGKGTRFLIEFER